MAIQVTSFASGSSGNCLLVRSERAAFLIDCGISQRAIERHLRHMGLSAADLTAILLTHEHGDHTLSAGPLARRYGLPIVANQPTIAALGDALAGVSLLAVDDTLELAGCQLRTFPVPHDAAAPIGYTLQIEQWCVGVAIDMGSWTEQIVAGLAEADLVVVEANHDRERLRFAPYAWPVKQRIYSPLGHLDNVDCGRLLARLGADGRRRTAWLAHLSEHANSPQIAVRTVENVLSMADCGCISVAALPRRAPLVWDSDRHMVQGELFSF